MGSSHLRIDATRNRDAILEAARELFAESDDFAMCEISRRAGVGQATLYRNFPDRGALAAEILVKQLDRVSQCAADCEGDPDAFFILMRALVEGLADLCALSELAQSDAGAGSQVELGRQRIAELMRRPLSDAKTAGTLRRDTSLDDIFLVLLMAKGAMSRAHGATARASAANRALTLALDGLALTKIRA